MEMIYTTALRSTLIAADTFRQRYVSPVLSTLGRSVDRKLVDRHSVHGGHEPLHDTELVVQDLLTDGTKQKAWMVGDNLDNISQRRRFMSIKTSSHTIMSTKLTEKHEES